MTEAGPGSHETIVNRPWRWLRRTPVVTFILCPLAVIAFELALHGGDANAGAGRKAANDTSRCFQSSILKQGCCRFAADRARHAAADLQRQSAAHVAAGAAHHLADAVDDAPAKAALHRQLAGDLTLHDLGRLLAARDALLHLGLAHFGRLGLRAGRSLPHEAAQHAVPKRT